MIDWTKPLRLTRRGGTATVVGALRGSSWPRIVKVTPPCHLMAETVMFLDESGYTYNSDSPEVENVPEVRTVTRYFVAHASDKGDSLTVHHNLREAQAHRDGTYTGIISKVEYTVTDGKVTDHVMTVLEDWSPEK